VELNWVQKIESRNWKPSPKRKEGTFLKERTPFGKETPKGKKVGKTLGLTPQKELRFKEGKGSLTQNWKGNFGEEAKPFPFRTQRIKEKELLRKEKERNFERALRTHREGFPTKGV